MHIARTSRTHPNIMLTWNEVAPMQSLFQGWTITQMFINVHKNKVECTVLSVEHQIEKQEHHNASPANETKRTQII